ncbi:peroxidase 55-like [Neltuma alba]|uniref:peroxidase 55-like n=1 Tax=Neltuma alba TaxID=207710 RepID=UPI0010A539EB|nr:peroxidase 55-like [Prosopis alba]
MEIRRRRRIVVLLMVFAMMCGGEAQLRENFYSSTCPNLEAIVNQAVTNKLAQTFTTIPGTLRLFFHDCMVEGCDASVMIQSPNNDAEKDAEINLTLAGDGFDTVVKVKEAVEAECPGLVSCADILALAARDVVALVGGPSFNVELGRRDGLVSSASRVEGNLPKANFNLNQLNAMFRRHGLSQTDMIALSGAHTVGFSHCNEFTDRLYSSTVDPSMNSDFAQSLMQQCPRNFDPQVAIDLDVQSPQAFDNLYYQNLVSGQGLLNSDQVLFTDSDSRSTVVEFANNAAEFNAAFATAMRKLGRVGVKTGNEGEIRKDCTKFNSS